MNNIPNRLTFVNKTINKEQLVIIMMYVILFIFLLFGFYFEKKPITGDSGNYIKFAQGGFDLLLNNEIDQYRFTRTFPSLFVGYTLRLFHISLTPEHIKNGFNLLNAAAIFIALYYWLKVCDLLKFNLKPKIIGFAGLIINFPILKFSMFNPILTDTLAFMLGIMLLFHFFKNNKFSILLITIIGAFTFPPLLAQGLILFIFPYEAKNSIVFKGKRMILPIITVFIYLLLICFVFFILPKDIFNKVIRRIPSGINFSLMIFSIIAVGYYIFRTSSKIISYDYYKSYIMKYLLLKVFWFRVVLALSIILLVKILTYRFASPNVGVNQLGFISTILISPLQNPFLFLLAHILYYGPIVILFIFFWNEVADFCNSIGLAFNLLLLLCIILSFQSESRMFISLVPIIVLAISNFLNTIKIKKEYLLFFIMLSLIFSRFWFKIWGANMQGNYLEFPMQKYFMVFGPWMSNIMYYVQGMIVLLCIIPFYLFVKHLYSDIEKSFINK